MPVVLSQSPLLVKLVEQGIDWPAWISAGAAVTTLAVVLITAGFALVSLQDARRTRHGQLITEIMRDWTQPGVAEAHRLHARYTESKLVALVDRIFEPGAEPASSQDFEDWTNSR